MSWRNTVTDWLADILRLIARAGLLIDAILISIFSVWFVYKGCAKLMELLNGWLFAS